MQNVQAKIYRECLYVYKKVNRRYNKLYHFKYKVGGQRINIVSDTLIFSPEFNQSHFFGGKKFRTLMWNQFQRLSSHFHDVDGDLSDHNVGKIFGLSKILTVIL